MMPEPNLIFFAKRIKKLKILEKKNCIFFTRAGVWNPFNICWFVGNQQKMKGRASQISCLSRKVRSMKWRPFWGIVKNARFHPTKHLSQWVSSQLKIGNLLFFGAHRDFRLFCSRWLFFLRNDHHVRAKWLTEVSRQKNKHNFLWGKEQKYWPQIIYCDFFRKLVAPAPNLQWHFSDWKWPPPPFSKLFQKFMTKMAVSNAKKNCTETLWIRNDRIFRIFIHFWNDGLP